MTARLTFGEHVVPKVHLASLEHVCQHVADGLTSMLPRSKYLKQWLSINAVYEYLPCVTDDQIPGTLVPRSLVARRNLAKPAGKQASDR